jgi:purine-binding chemotaxis protein CheW
MGGKIVQSCESPGEFPQTQNLGLWKLPWRGGNCGVFDGQMPVKNTTSSLPSREFPLSQKPFKVLMNKKGYNFHFACIIYPSLNKSHKGILSIIRGKRERFMEKQLVVFELATEFYGVDIAHVDGIVKMQPITKVPHSPAFVEGVTNLRGTVLPVIDLRKRFGLEPTEVGRESRIINIVIEDTKVGMIVDSVSEVLTIQDSIIEEAPRMVTSVNSSFITGIAKLDNRLVILLDLRQILVPDEVEQLTALPSHTG